MIFLVLHLFWFALCKRSASSSVAPLCVFSSASFLILLHFFSAVWLISRLFVSRFLAQHAESLLAFCPEGMPSRFFKSRGGDGPKLYSAAALTTASCTCFFEGKIVFSHRAVKTLICLPPTSREYSVCCESHRWVRGACKANQNGVWPLFSCPKTN